MRLDRAPGRFFDVTIQASIRRSWDSAAEARRLLDAGFPGPAYVWSVRSIEVFVKEVMLLPVFLEEIEGEPDEFDSVWQQAREKVEDTFESSKWNRALRKVQEAYGALDPMLTEDDKDVWDVWKSTVVRRRGDTVHGRITDEGDPTLPEAERVVEWTERMMSQLTIRLAANTTHPLSDLLVAAFEKAGKAYKDEQATGT